MIKVAVVKFCALATGGTERFLQTIAVNLAKKKEDFDVTCFYCDSVPYVGSSWKHPDTDSFRKAYVENSNVKLVKFDLEAKDITKPHHPWINTNFWSLFKEEDYDIIQTGRAGHPEYPFTEIKKTPIIDIITLPGMADKNPLIKKSIHISQWQADSWVRAGGNSSLIEIVPICSEVPEIDKASSFREKLGISKTDFVYGMHQRADDGIMSPVPLQAYGKIENEDTHFVLMGGGDKYQKQAQELGLKNFHHISHSGDEKDQNDFLETLDVFAHGRSDGETMGLAIAEAMYHGLPVISHVAPAMGHKETIGNAGNVVETEGDYIAEMLRLKNSPEYREELSVNAKKRYNEYLSLETNINKIERIYREVLEKERLNNLSGDSFWEQRW
jgi:glycosyltransferase involved in cell wall biosynthesis